MRAQEAGSLGQGEIVLPELEVMLLIGLRLQTDKFTRR